MFSFYRIAYHAAGNVVAHCHDAPVHDSTMQVSAVAADALSGNLISMSRAMGLKGSQRLNVAIKGGIDVSLLTENLALGCNIADAYVEGQHRGAYLTLLGENPEAEHLAFGLFKAKVKLLLPESPFQADDAFGLVPLTRLPTLIAVRLQDQPFPKSLVTMTTRAARYASGDSGADEFERSLGLILFGGIIFKRARRR